MELFCKFTVRNLRAQLNGNRRERRCAPRLGEHFQLVSKNECELILTDDLYLAGARLDRKQPE